MKLELEKLKIKYDKLKLTEGQKFEFKFRVNDLILYTEWDESLPAAVYSYIVLFSDYPKIKYIELKWVAGVNETTIVDIKEISPAKYTEEINKMINQFEEIHRKRLKN